MDIYNSDYKLLKSEFKTTVNLLIQHVLCSLIILKQPMNYLCLQAAVQEFTIALWAQQSFAKPGMASQNRRKKLRRFIQLSNQSTYIFASFCKAMLATQSLLNPKKQIVDRWITGWSPSPRCQRVIPTVYLTSMPIKFIYL